MRTAEMTARTGTVFDVSRFRTDDGPGIRTAVFLKGCPLRCIWCHNPESYLKQPVLMVDMLACMHCGRCAAACGRNCHTMENGLHCFDGSRCTACGECVAGCPAGALRVAGREYTVDEVMEVVLRDRAFYGHGGGMTLTGGEPLFQPEFSAELLKRARIAGIHSCVETCGYGKWENLALLAENTDLFLFDLKAGDSEKHRRFTGVAQEGILNNLVRLDRQGKRIWLRLPVIPGCNDGDDDLIGIARIVNSLQHPELVEVMPYHPLGNQKRRMLRMESEYANSEFPEQETVRHWCEVLRAHVGIPIRSATR